MRSRSAVFIAFVWFALVTGVLVGLRHLARLVVFAARTGGLTESPLPLEVLAQAVFLQIIVYGGLLVILLAAGALLRFFPLERAAVLVFAFWALTQTPPFVSRIGMLGASLLGAGAAAQLTRWYARRRQALLGFWRRTLSWTVAAASLALLLAYLGPRVQERAATNRLAAAPPGSPNILLVIIDALRADHLSAYGYARPTSPNLDRIAREGILFENALATSSWSLPSHVSLFTGCYPHEHGAETNFFDGRCPTIARVLRARGYRTGTFSANYAYFARSAGFGRGFLHFEDHFRSVADMAEKSLYGPGAQRLLFRLRIMEDVPGRWRAPDINRSVLRRVDASRPFFVAVNYFDAHEPYVPPAPFRARFSPLKAPGGILNSFVDRVPRNSEELQGEIDAYDAAIAYVDHHIGRLWAALEERGLARNTILAITSDHGESFGEHALYWHGYALYRETLHVPLILRWPAAAPAGVRVARPMSTCALPATLLELAGLAEPDAIPGPSLSALWNNGAAGGWQEPLAELAHSPEENQRFPVAHGWMKSLVTERWHYIVHEKFGEELYDWTNDRAELTNLAGTPEGKRIAAELGARLRARLAAGSAPPHAADRARPGKAVEQRQ